MANETAPEAPRPDAPSARADEPRRPRFSRNFPANPELDALVAAFEAGDYGRVRRDAPRLAERAEDPEVKRAAKTLRSRVEADPLAILAAGAHGGAPRGARGILDREGPSARRERRRGARAWSERERKVGHAETACSPRPCARGGGVRVLHVEQRPHDHQRGPARSPGGVGRDVQRVHLGDRISGCAWRAS